MSIKQRAYSGIGWMGLTQLLGRASQFAVNLLLARLLAPAAIGTIGLLTAIFALVLSLTELGLNAAIVQRRDLKEGHLSTAFFLNLGLGFFWACATIVLAPLIGRFFHNPVLSEILRVYSAAFVIAAFASVQRALLARKLDFRRLAIAETGASLTGSLLALILALAGFGIWALVWGGLTTHLVAAVLLWRSSGWRPSRQFSLQAFNDLFGFGGGVLATRLLGLLSQKLDVLIIGRLMPASSVGIYTLSYRVALIFPEQIGGVLTSVLFPVFSEIQSNHAGLRHSYLYVTKYLALVTMPVTAGLMLVAPQFVDVILGDQWLEAIPVLRLLALVGLTTGLGGPLWTPVLNATGRSYSVLAMTAIRVAALGAFILVGSTGGVVGVATAVALYGVVFRFVYQHIVNRLIGLRMVDFLHALVPAVRSTLPMIAVLALMQWSFSTNEWGTTALQLLLLVAIGGLTFAAALRLTCREELDELLKNALAVLRGAQATA